MGFSFGTKKSEVTENDGVYLRNFKKGETKVRFLEEPGDWFRYREHFMNRQSFPCTQTELCPGCTHEDESVQRAAVRYGTFAWFVDQKRVLPVKIGPRLSDRLTIRAERNDKTLLSRDYVIIRSGSALETDYDVDQDERYTLDIDELLGQKGEFTAEQIVARQFEALWGDPNKYSDDARKEERVSKPAEDKVPDTLKTKDEKEAEENVEVSEDELKKMSRPQLVEIYNKAGFPDFDEDWGKSDLIEQILKRAS